ncbi:MAG: type II secretion system minor pseudopilin GspI [Deltaproteobacteria bacterium]
MVRRFSQRGFTLLEVMVALAVIATAFTALLSLHVENLRTLGREEAYSRALLLAETLAAESQLEGWPDLGTSKGDFEAATPGEAKGFVWQREVSEWILPGTREVRIRVTPSFGEEAAVELTVFVSRNLR